MRVRIEFEYLGWEHDPKTQPEEYPGNFAKTEDRDYHRVPLVGEHVRLDVQHGMLSQVAAVIWEVDGMPTLSLEPVKWSSQSNRARFLRNGWTET